MMPKIPRTISGVRYARPNSTREGSFSVRVSVGDVVTSGSLGVEGLGSPGGRVDAALVNGQFDGVLAVAELGPGAVEVFGAVGSDMLDGGKVQFRREQHRCIIRGLGQRVALRVDDDAQAFAGGAGAV